MKAPKRHTLSRKGFTLVELLVVISIIAILATLAVAGARSVIDKAKKVEARAGVKALSDAIDQYLDKELQLPLSEGQDTDTEKRSDNELMSVLVGLESAEAQNPTRFKFFTFKKAKGNGNNRYNGLYQTATQAEFYGPWKNKNRSERFFRIIFDYDYDEEITEPSNLGNEVQYGYRYLIYSLGKDGKAGSDKNVDNIYSWK